MDEIEKENPKLKRILNKTYAQQQIDNSKMVELIVLISNIPISSLSPIKYHQKYP